MAKEMMSKIQRKIGWYLVVCFGLSLLAGCSVPVPPDIYWPPPPNEPKLKWVTTFSSEDNFPKTSGQVTQESVIGKPELHFFAKPMGIVADGKGIVYVADLDKRNVRVVDFNKKTMEFLTKEPAFRLPVGLALDARGRLYVADAVARQVLVFGPDRTPLHTIGSKDLFEKPVFLVVNDELGRLYVTDVKANNVEVFDLEGKHLFSFGEPGMEEGQLHGPQGIAIDSKGQVFIAEQYNARVQAFDAEGKHLFFFGERGDFEWMFEGPRGVGFDSEDNLYVAENRKSALMVFKADGTRLTRLGGSPTIHPLGFRMPSSVWVDRNDQIYITDSMNRSFTVWQYLNEDYLRTHPLSKERLQQLEQKSKEMMEGKK